jgi:hypothetical protein
LFTRNSLRSGRRLARPEQQRADDNSNPRRKAYRHAASLTSRGGLAVNVIEMLNVGWAGGEDPMHADAEHRLDCVLTVASSLMPRFP